MCFKIALELQQIDAWTDFQRQCVQSLAEAIENDLEPYLVSL